MSSAVALFDFPPEEPDDLGFVKGDILVVLHSDDEWWEGKLQNGDGCAFHNTTALPFAPTHVGRRSFAEPMGLCLCCFVLLFL